MAIIWNIRGTNGSGKTTVARAFLPPNLRGDHAGGPVDLSWYDSPTKREPDRRLRYPGYVQLDDRVLVLGKYTVDCGGMDNHPAGKGFEEPRKAIWHALGGRADAGVRLSVDHVICEGVLASGVYGSWHEFARELWDAGHELCFVYMQTSLDTCLERIQARRVAAGSAPKEGADWDRMVKNVTDKFTGTAATREKAIRDGHRVYDLPLDNEIVAMEILLVGGGEAYRARA